MVACNCKAIVSKERSDGILEYILLTLWLLQSKQFKVFTRGRCLSAILMRLLANRVTTGESPIK